MSSADATAKFRLLGEDATAAAFKSALHGAEGTAEKMKHIFEGAFAGISIAGIVEIGAHAIELGDDLNKASIKAGIGANAISELAYAAKMSDVPLEALSTALRKMQIAISEAGTGATKPKEALAALGITLEQLKGLAADQQFELIGEQIKQLHDPADKARAATELFGKAGAELLPMFEQGAAGIRKAREEAQKLGVSFSGEQLKSLTEAADATKELKSAWEGFAVAITTKATPALIGILDLLHGELPKSSLESQIANINYQMSFLEGTTTERGLKKLDELRGKLLQLQEQQHPYEDFAARQARAGAHAANGYQQDSTGLNDVLVSAQRIGEKQQSLTEYAEELHSESLKKMLEDTRTYSEETSQAYTASFDKIVALRDADVIDDAEALKRMADLREDFNNNQLADVEVLGKHMEVTMDSMSQMARDASVQMQGAFEQFFFDPAHEGLKGLGLDIVNIARQIIAERAAMALFDSKSSGGMGLGGIISGAFNTVLSDSYGGPKAEGGPLTPGKWHIAGEYGPEPIWGGGPGAFAVGYGKGSGASQVTQHISIDARGSTVDSVKLLQATIPSIIRRAVDQSRVAVKNDISRGMLRSALS